MDDKKLCEICDQPIEGKPFNLSNLAEPLRMLKVCENCAAGPDVTIYHAGIEVVVDRDDFLKADKERLYYAVEAACCGLEELGWELESIGISGRSAQLKEPLDLE